MKAIGQKGFAYENLIGNQSFLEVSQLKGQGRHSKKLNIADSLETDIEFVYQGRRRFLAAITVLQQDLQVQPRHPWVVQTPQVYINFHAMRFGLDNPFESEWACSLSTVYEDEHSLPQSTLLKHRFLPLQLRENLRFE
jgi:hypothetical protein